MVQQTCIDPSQTSNDYDKSILHASLDNSGMTFGCSDPTFATSFPNPFNKNCSTLCSPKKYDDAPQSDKLCVLLQNKIFYYPKSTAAQQVMGKVIKKLDAFRNFVQNIPPVFNINLTASSQIKSQIGNDPTFYGLWRAAIYKSCNIPAAARVIGVASRADLMQQTKMLSQNNSRSQNFIPHLWASVSFENSPNDISTTPFKYKILYEVFTGQKVHKQVSWLQDIIEASIIELQTNSTPTFGKATKKLPQKCWTTASDIPYQNFYFMIPLLIMMGFLISPAQFLEQLLVEKELKLREYLNIMGVGNMMLKFSWILFYTIMQIPVVLMIGIIISFVIPDIFVRTDPSVIFVLLILYMISILAFVYMLSCILQSSRRCKLIFTFINMFFFVLADFNTFSGVLIFKGSNLIQARICGLHPITNVVQGVRYIIAWERFWMGAQWKNAFHHPFEQDQYLGFGESMMWQIGITILYILIAWYVEHIAPGEFGVRYPPWFIFQPSFWFPKKFGRKFKQLEPPEDADVEPMLENNEPGISLQALTKQYSRNKIGVNNLTLTFYKNQITAFLGQNGAGKSTTMNTLVGLISPSNGQAWVNGLSVEKEIDKIRDIVGFVPQYDILYPCMTVAEHLQFFGWLKGLSRSDTRNFIDPILKKMDMLEKKNTIITKLSGGQKRKLSILTAYIGDPEVIILDEPTSGVDPFSRRTIWELILDHRRDSTTILSTHHMEEADILGDRVAIINLGILKCCGSSMFLKNHYGQGFRLTVACNPQNPNKPAVKQFIQQNVSKSRLIQESGHDLTFSVPMEFAHSENMTPFLRKLEDTQMKLGMASYGLSEPTMEEVFFSAASVNEKSDTEPMENGDGIPLVGSERNRSQSTITSDQIQYPKYEGAGRYIRQALALFKKRLLITLLSWTGYLVQLFCPMAIVFLMIMIGQSVQFATPMTTMVTPWSNYRSTSIFFQDSTGQNFANPFISSAAGSGLGPRCPAMGNMPGGARGCSKAASPPSSMLSNPTNPLNLGSCQSCKGYCSNNGVNGAPHVKIPSSDLMYRIGGNTNVSRWVLHANQSSIVVTGGIQFKQIDNNKLQGLYTKLGNIQGATSSWVTRDYTQIR